MERVEEQRQSIKKNIDDIADKNISDLKDILKTYTILLHEFRSASEKSKKRMQDLYHERKN